MLFEIKNLEVDFGGAVALNKISLEVGEGDLVTVIGANGAGKSTLLRTISGLERATSGEIIFDGNNIVGKTPEEIVMLGIAQCPENRRLFNYLTVIQNLKLGAYLRKDRGEIAKDLESIYKRYPVLRERKNQRAKTLSGGEQQMVAVGRALMSKPRLLLLDEPSTGLAPRLVMELRDIIKEINQQTGVAVLLVEQNVKMALSAAKRGYVLETGEITMAGTSEELSKSEAVQKAYLGV